MRRRDRDANCSCRASTAWSAARRALALVEFAAAVAVVLTGFPAMAAGPTQAEIDRAIARAVEYLKPVQEQFGVTSGAQSLRAYALIRAGEPADGPVVAPVIERILAKCTSSYDPRTQHIYTAAVDLMALEAAGSDLFHPQIEMIANYLISKQNSNGSWDYVDRNRTQGDTSQSQYAILGLWAAARAGIDVPLSVWDGAARWHLATQLKNGAWAYHPDENTNPRHTMTAAGVGSLYVCRMFVAPGAGNRSRSTLMIQPTRKYGLLEPVELGAATPAGSGAESKVRDDRPKLSRSEIDSGIQRGLNWLTANYTIKVLEYQYYYLYGIERMAALGELATVGNRDWYADGAAFLLSQQKSDGSWQDNSGAVPSTSFGILFLSRATSKLIDRPKRTRLGGGLLAGGRGLPEDLNQVQVEGGKVESRKPSGPIDELLAELERPGELQIQEVQTAIVEKVQLGDREQLIGQKDRLKRLAADPRVEVRRTAVWALGHTGDLRLAPLLIEALKDPELALKVEAHNALCTLSRDPLAFGLPGDPLHGVPEDAPESQRTATIEKWRDEAYRKWRDWYLTVRPYDERDDLTKFRIRK